MRRYDEYREILIHWEQRTPKKRISNITGVSYNTVKRCIARFQSLNELDEYIAQSELFEYENCTDYPLERQAAYVYLLGLYLGDGHIVRSTRSYRMAVSLDDQYPNIIADCTVAMKMIFPVNSVRSIQKIGSKRIVVQSSQLPDLFPQHGIGAKHTRKIILEHWQSNLVHAHPLAFFKGLYHSDGSRFSNFVNGKDYPRYQFTNTSQDIIQLFCQTCDQLGLGWTSKTRRSAKSTTLATDIFISRRKDVEYLDQVVRAKR